MINGNRMCQYAAIKNHNSSQQLVHCVSQASTICATLFILYAYAAYLAPPCTATVLLRTSICTALIMPSDIMTLPSALQYGLCLPAWHSEDDIHGTEYMII